MDSRSSPLELCQDYDDNQAYPLTRDALGISFEELYQHIKTNPDIQEGLVLDKIINKVQGRNLEEQQGISTMIDQLMEWKGFLLIMKDRYR